MGDCRRAGAEVDFALPPDVVDPLREWLAELGRRSPEPAALTKSILRRLAREGVLTAPNPDAFRNW
jgi:hypothetical protein